jgi:hypothetical protein
MAEALDYERAWKEAPTPRARAPDGFTLTMLADIDPHPRKLELVYGFLGAGELSVFYGLPGCGKSVLVADGAAHVAAGLPWFDRTVTQGAVLYIAAERAGLVKRRLAAWRQRHGAHDAPLAVLEGIFDFVSSTDGAERVLARVEQLAEVTGCVVVWIIVDTKTRVMGAGDPNSDQDTGALIASLGVLQSSGAHVSVVDHVPHTAPDRMKGSGALAGAADASFLIRHEGDVRTVGIGSKQPNDGPDELTLFFTLEPETLFEDEVGKTTAPVVVPLSADERLNPDRALARAARLPAGAQRVLQAYGRLVDEGRFQSPPSSVPGADTSMRAVAREDLRAMAFSLGLGGPAPDDETDRSKWRNSRNAAFNRGEETLTKAAVLRVESGFAWAVTR